jgi:gluconokinase
MTRTPRIVAVMGVSGAGKTTVGLALADKLGVPYAEADAFHPAANVAKMAAGQPLDDDDRRPWLLAIADWIATHADEGGVVSCSALKYVYRELLRSADPMLWFLHLHADRDVIAARVAGREGHFMPVSLVDSQFAALEPLRADEPGAVIDASLPTDEIVRTTIAALDGRSV